MAFLNGSIVAVCLVSLAVVDRHVSVIRQYNLVQVKGSDALVLGQCGFWRPSNALCNSCQQ